MVLNIPVACSQSEQHREREKKKLLRNEMEMKKGKKRKIQAILFRTLSFCSSRFHLFYDHRMDLKASVGYDEVGSG